MRAELRRWQLATHDTGFLTEPQMWKRLADNKSTPWTVARNASAYPLELLLEAAGAVGNDAAAQSQLAGLVATNDAVRYWSAVGLNARLNLDSIERETLRRALLDDSPVVRIEAAAALARHNEPLPALPVLITALNEDTDVALHTARALELLGPVADPAQPAMRIALDNAREQETRGDILAMFLRFSLEAALSPRTSLQRNSP
jgi:HEAT repeat protein